MNKTLRFDSEKQNLFFTSDPHFGHHNVIEYCGRPHKDVREMNQALVDNWNSVVGDEDHIFVLGDFALASSETIKHVFNSLKGIKYLILGNHDKHWRQPWEKVTQIQNLLIDDPEIKDGQRISLCHYPMKSWYQSHRGSWQLFGHIHEYPMAVSPNQLNVGVDVHDFMPISYQEVKTIITKQNLK